MIGIFIALLSGALMSIQGVFNTEVTERTSIWVAGAFVQLTALIVCLAAWGITDRSSFMELNFSSQEQMNTSECAARMRASGS